MHQINRSLTHYSTHQIGLFRSEMIIIHSLNIHIICELICFEFEFESVSVRQSISQSVSERMSDIPDREAVSRMIGTYLR